MISPNDFKILPKPSLITVSVWLNGISIPEPTSKQATNRAKNAGILNLVVSSTITTMPTTRRKKIYAKEWVIEVVFVGEVVVVELDYRHKLNQLSQLNQPN